MLELPHANIVAWFSIIFRTAALPLAIIFIPFRQGWRFRVQQHIVSLLRHFLELVLPPFSRLPADRPNDKPARSNFHLNLSTQPDLFQMRLAYAHAVRVTEFHNLRPNYVSEYTTPLYVSI